MKKYAIIDLGSNTIRLVIFEVYKNGSYKLVESLSDTVRLGHGVNETGKLSDESMLKAIETLSVFVDFCKSFDVSISDIHTYATAAVRLSDNGQLFADKLSRLFGLDVIILSGTQEAMYSYTAVCKTFDHKTGLVVDIGGGSTEIVLFKDGKVSGCASLPYGCVSVSELYLLNDTPPSKENVYKVTEVITNELNNLPWLHNNSISGLFGIGGTLRAFAKIHMRKHKYPYPKIHNYIIPATDLYTLKNELIGMNKYSIKRIPGLSSDRRDVVTGGLLILCTICSFASIETIILSGAGLREGVFYEILRDKKMIPEYSSALEFGIKNFMLQYNIRKEHAEKVSYLSTKLFRELSPLHKIPDENIKYVKTAALIHDAGIHISYYNHDRHSLYLILNSPLFALNHKEQLIVAIAASGLFGHKLKETLKGSYYRMLDKNELTIAKMMAVFIRLAEALDKSETGCIKDISCEIAGNIVLIKTIKIKEASIELRSVLEYSPIFQKMFGKRLEII